MSIRHKMSPGFAKLEGGLRSKVAKADVGSSYARLAEQGVDLLGWADPFYADPLPPPQVVDATVGFIKSGKASHYTMPIGDLQLRIEVAKKLKTQNSISADPERNIMITPGSDSGLFYAIAPFIEPGDEVMVPDPSYPNNFVVPELMGGVAVRVPLSEDSGYQLDVEEFRKRLTPKTKMVVLTHPNNPTATVFRREGLMELARFIVANDLVLVVDQAFEDHIFDGIEYVNMATLPGMWERTLSVFSMSKGMALSGFRVGYIVADDDVMDVLYGGAVSVVVPPAAHRRLEQ
jgi:aspartate/methionine/tyrosine aminotransferase